MLSLESAQPAMAQGGAALLVLAIVRGPTQRRCVDDLCHAAPRPLELARTCA